MTEENSKDSSQTLRCVLLAPRCAGEVNLWEIISAVTVFLTSLKVSNKILQWNKKLSQNFKVIFGKASFLYLLISYTESQIHNTCGDTCPAENRRSAAEAVYNDMNCNHQSITRCFPGCLLG